MRETNARRSWPGNLNLRDNALTPTTSAAILFSRDFDFGTGKEELEGVGEGLHWSAGGDLRWRSTQEREVRREGCRECRDSVRKRWVDEGWVYMHFVNGRQRVPSWEERRHRMIREFQCSARME